MIAHMPSSRRFLALSIASRSVFFSTVTARASLD
jgi:hypothetical protein